MTLDGGSWGYRRNMRVEEVLTIDEVLYTLVKTISCGGNILVNVGPNKDGVVVPIFEERLLQMGAWLEANAEAVYGSSPWIHQNDSTNPDVWYTFNKGSVYAFVLGWPDQDTVILSDPKVDPARTKVTMLGHPQTMALRFEMSPQTGQVAVQFPSMSALLRGCPFCQWVYVVKFENLKAPSLEEVLDAQEEANEIGEEKRKEEEDADENQNLLRM